MVPHRARDIAIMSLQHCLSMPHHTYTTYLHKVYMQQETYAMRSWANHRACAVPA